MSGRRALEALVAVARERGAREILLAAGRVPLVEVAGELQALDVEALDPTVLERAVGELGNAETRDRFAKLQEVEVSILDARGAGFVARLSREASGVGARITLVERGSADETLFAEASLPKAAERVLRRGRGLTLVAGSPRLASLATARALVRAADALPSTARLVAIDRATGLSRLQPDECVLREVGSDAESFELALRGSALADADAVLVGDLPRAADARAAFELAASGLLVVAVVPAPDVLSAIRAVQAVCDTEEGSPGRELLGETLGMLLAVDAVPRGDGRGDAPVFELLLGSAAVAGMIRDGRFEDIPELLEAGAGAGMQSFDGCLTGLVREGVVRREDAIARARNPAALERSLARKRD